MAPPRAPRPPRVAVSKPVPAEAISSMQDDPPRPDDAVEVGRVLGAWGVRGGIKVKPFSADPQALFSSKRWWIEPGQRSAALAGVAPRRSLPRLLRVVQAREQGDAVVATCHEFADRDAAEALTGARVFVSRSSFPTPGDNEFYWVDLIGLQVRNRAGLLLGTVSTLIETGPHCVLSIDPPVPGDGTLLIPFVDAYVDRVDREGRTIHVDWDPGYSE